MHFYDPEMVIVGLRGDLLNVVRLNISDVDHILSIVLEPAEQHKVAKGPALRSWGRAFCDCFDRLRD